LGKSDIIAYFIAVPRRENSFLHQLQITWIQLINSHCKRKNTKQQKAIIRYGKIIKKMKDEKYSLRAIKKFLWQTYKFKVSLSPFA